MHQDLLYKVYVLNTRNAVRESIRNLYAIEIDLLEIVSKKQIIVKANILKEKIIYHKQQIIYVFP